MKNLRSFLFRFAESQLSPKYPQNDVYFILSQIRIRKLLEKEFKKSSD